MGTLFNDIRILRTTTPEDDSIGSTGDVISEFKVPITYAPKEKVLSRLTQDVDLKRPFAISLPRMSFELTNITYAPTRKLGTTKTIIVKDPDAISSPKYVYSPVPYDLQYSLYIYSKSEEDGNKIIEQILPFFTPDFSPTVYLLPEMDLIVDIPIILNSVTHEEQYEGDFVERKAVIWTLSFTLKGFFYGPVSTSAIIKFTTTNFIDLDNLGTLETMRVQPGLTANGEPTTSANDSISPLNINVDDPWGTVIEIDSE